MSNVCKIIENRLKLVVNIEKSQVAKSDRVKFLSMTIVDGSIAISHNALQSAGQSKRTDTARQPPDS